ncbi:MAG: 30S ribosomal protein S24e [Thermoplasmata archaeon HGW-Thermoplasmata-1]|nr:MAG: 30S ribosomal protein S24e [Thermoplasmata archaeon HGW-Thermoplasmata-1]
MELEIVSKKENKLLGRTEITFRAVHEGERTPKRKIVRDQLAAQLGAKKGTVIVDGMNTNYGENVTEGYAKIYASAEQAMTVERKHILKRNADGEKKKEE